MNEVDTHPLYNKKEWVFTQPTIRVNSSVMLKDLATDEEIKCNITSSSSCREGMISDIRTALQRRTTNFVKLGDRAWEGNLKLTHSISLGDPRCLGNGETVLLVHTKERVISRKDAQDFLKVSDAVVGIPCALLNPNRKPGDWWRTDPAQSYQKFKDDHYTLEWWGADNFVLQHPALFASVLGLYRQVFLLFQAGWGRKVLESIDHSRVERVLTEPSWKDALELAEQLRPWISVPVPTHGLVSNIPFPWYPRQAKQVSYWQRFIRLQRALHRYPAEEVFGGDFVDGWALLNKGPQYTGAFALWGEAKTLTAAHKKLMELGKPKEKSSGSE